MYTDATQGLSPRKSPLVRSRDDSSPHQIGLRTPWKDDDSKLHRRRRRGYQSKKIMFQRLVLLFRSYADSIKQVCLVLCGSWLLFITIGGGRVEDRSAMGWSNGERRIISHTRNMKLGGVDDMRSLGYEARPRALATFFTGVGDVVSGVARLDPHPDLYPSKRIVEEMTETLEPGNENKLSKKYKRRLRDRIDVGDCVAHAEWQKTHYPSCSNIHEVDLSDLHATSRADENIRLLNNGYFSDIFRIRGFDGEYTVLKGKRYVHEFTDRNFHRFQKEAISMERLTSSPHIIDIYGFCGVTTLIEYSDGGDLGYAAIDHKDSLTQIGKLRIAHQVAVALADVHAFPIAHTDITLWQFLKTKGVYKLNDFNRARWMRWDKANNEPCGFRVAMNNGKWRAPEEYSYKVETEKVDVYSMGNIFYVLLTGHDIFEDTRSDDVGKMVINGGRPHLDPSVRESTDAANSALIFAMTMCHVQDAEKRATAKKVADFLGAELANLERMQGV